MCLVSSKALSVATHKIPIKKVFVSYYADVFCSPYFPLSGKVFKKEELPLLLKPVDFPKVMRQTYPESKYIYGSGFIHAYKEDTDVGNRYRFKALVQDVSLLHAPIIICLGFIPEGAKYVEEDGEICATEMFITEVASTFTT